MNKIFIDTNIILDLLAKRKPFHLDSLQLFSLADKGRVELIVSTLSIVNSHYILNDIMKLKDSKSIIGRFKVLVTSIDLSDKIVELALNDSSFNDFEDGIQFFTAQESQSESIITRNTKGFKKSTIPIFTPKEYLANYY